MTEPDTVVHLCLKPRGVSDVLLLGDDPYILIRMRKTDVASYLTSFQAGGGMSADPKVVSQMLSGYAAMLADGVAQGWVHLVPRLVEMDPTPEEGK